MSWTIKQVAEKRGLVPGSLRRLIERRAGHAPKEWTRVLPELWARKLFGRWELTDQVPSRSSRG